MRTQTLLTATALLTCSACAPVTTTVVPAAPAGQPHWVQGPTSQVRTLLLDPVDIGPVAVPGRARSRLRVGAFFARYQRGDGPVDQLALMLEVTGPDADHVLDGSRALLLDVDGELFIGEPGASSNSVRVDQVEDAGRVTLVIPITPEYLTLLADAREVRGRVGLWAGFSFPTRARARFQALLEGLPEGAPRGLPSDRTFYRATDRSQD